jgi:adenine C2-methylase RlmN of 23S rRNA A2503 and tRNA A37
MYFRIVLLMCIPRATSFSMHVLVRVFFPQSTGRRVSFEYTLLEGVNNSLEQVRIVCN